METMEGFRTDVFRRSRKEIRPCRRLVLNDPVILPENVYNMNETGVMLSMPGSVKVLVGKDDLRKYRGARVKRITVTAIECIN